MYVSAKFACFCVSQAGLAIVCTCVFVGVCMNMYVSVCLKGCEVNRVCVFTYVNSFLSMSK